MFESGIWWIGQFEPDLAHLVHGYQDEEAGGSNPNAGFGSDPYRNNGFSDGFYHNIPFGTDAYGSNRYPGRFDQTSDHGNDPFANNDFQDGFYPNADFGPNRYEHNHFPDRLDRNSQFEPDPSENNNFQGEFDPNAGFGSHDNNGLPDWFNRNSQFEPDPFGNNNFQRGFDPNAGFGSYDNNDPPDWFNQNGNNNEVNPNNGLGNDTHGNNDQDVFTDSLGTEGSNSSADSETDGQNETGTSQIPAKKCLAIGKAVSKILYSDFRTWQFLHFICAPPERCKSF